VRATVAANVAATAVVNGDDDADFVYDVYHVWESSVSSSTVSSAAAALHAQAQAAAAGSGDAVVERFEPFEIDGREYRYVICCCFYVCSLLFFAAAICFVLFSLLMRLRRRGAFRAVRN
jgi:hypothetical protein